MNNNAAAAAANADEHFHDPMPVNPMTSEQWERKSAAAAQDPLGAAPSPKVVYMRLERGQDGLASLLDNYARTSVDLAELDREGAAVESPAQQILPALPLGTELWWTLKNYGFEPECRDHLAKSDRFFPEMVGQVLSLSSEFDGHPHCAHTGNVKNPGMTWKCVRLFAFLGEPGAYQGGAMEVQTPSGDWEVLNTAPDRNSVFIALVSGRVPVRFRGVESGRQHRLELTVGNGCPDQQ